MIKTVIVLRLPVKTIGRRFLSAEIIAIRDMAGIMFANIVLVTTIMFVNTIVLCRSSRCGDGKR